VTTVLSDGYLLTAVQVPGSYTVTDPVDGPSTGLFYLEVFQGKISGATSHKQVLTDLTSGTEYVRVYVRYTGWSAWTERGTGGGVDTDLTVGNRTATTLDILSSTGADATVPAASETEAGLLSAADKAKLNTIAESADPFVGTDLAVANKTATTLDITSSTGVDVTLPAASTSEAGLMSAADKTTMGTVATAASTFGTTDRLLRSDGTGRGLQSSGITISDADAVSGVTGLTMSLASGLYPTLSIGRTDAHGSGVAVGMISFDGRDSGAAAQQFAYIYALANDATAASEDGSFVFGTPVAGTVADRMVMTGSALYPATSDGMTLGLSSRMWADLFLADGGVINFNAGDVTITHGTNLLTFAGATGGYAFDALLWPSTHDGAALGSTSFAWSDLYLATGGNINIGNGSLRLLESSGSFNIGLGSDTRAQFTASGYNSWVSGAAMNNQYLRTDAHGVATLGYTARWFGTDSGGATQEYSRITHDCIDNTAAAEDGNIEFWTSVAGSLGQRVTIQAGVLIGSATGGDKGVGTLNATAVYDDNTLLTCYVMEANKTGSVDIAEWDRYAVDRVVRGEYDEIIDIEKRQHFGARKFAARLANPNENPLVLENYIRHWKEKDHLSSLPSKANYDRMSPKESIGDWVQRLVETVELQAIHDAALLDRINALEARIVVLETPV
jgi:hypothetical protein